jgi:hypothetical protein
MASECYWCVSGKAAYGNQLGTMGFPFACCHRCQVFTCGHHGQRDNGIQKFYCFDCDKTILIASAIAIANLQPLTIDQLAAQFGNIFASVSSDERFKSLEDFKRRREGYLHFLDQIEEGYIDYDNWADGLLKNLFRNFPYDAQKLLVAAAIIIADTSSEDELEKQGNRLFLELKTSLKVPSYEL